MTIIVTGAGGMLGQAVVRAGHALGDKMIGFTHAEFDITKPDSISAAIVNLPSPHTIINCAGIVRGRTDVGEAQRWAVNAMAPWALAVRCDRLVQVSTDCVFDGNPKYAAFGETSAPTPIDWYGTSKMGGEVARQPHVTVRGSFIGFESGLMAWFLRQPPNATVDGYEDHVWNGGYVDDYAACLLGIAVSPDLTGIIHLVGEWVTKDELLHNLADHLRPDITVRSVLGPDGPRHMVLKATRSAVPRLADKEAMLRQITHEYATRRVRDLMEARS